MEVLILRYMFLTCSHYMLQSCLTSPIPQFPQAVPKSTCNFCTGQGLR